MIRYGSVCSGIEAATVAVHPLGWRAAWFSEVEPFACSVLAHHYPDVPNLGDMTRLPARILAGEIEAPDVLVGGTPCQAFSVAGMREGLADARGQLTIKFVEVADAIDTVRRIRGQPPCIAWWENVPGVLSDKGNAFGCFLGALAGEDCALVAPGKRWADAGVVFGPARTIAWRILDAQYFGLAQRRRRVFVVASDRRGIHPAQILFELDGVRRDSAPSREAGEIAAPCVTACAANGGAAHGARSGSAKDNLITPVITMAHGQGGAEIGFYRGPCFTCNHEAPIAAIPSTAHTLRGEGFDASEDGTGRGTPLVPVAYAPDVAGTLVARSSRGGGQTNSPGHQADQQLAAFHPTQDPISSTDGTTHCMGTGNSQGGATIAVAFAENTRAEVRLEGGDGSRTGALSTGGGKPGQGVPCVAYTTKLHNTGSNNAGKIFEERTTCLDANSPPPAMLTAMQVRRLTPVECERLQGFPDGYTAIPWRKKPASECPDGPRYKAIGNSMAVNVMRWIGARIDMQLKGAT